MTLTEPMSVNYRQRGSRRVNEKNGGIHLRRIDLRDLALLNELHDGNYLNKFNGLTIRGFRLDRTYDAIYKRLILLESYGYVHRGFQVAQADTYFITQEGIQFYEKART